MEYTLIIIYFFLLIGLYFIIIKRMKAISYRHMSNTGLKSLGRGYEIIRRRLVVVLFFLFFVSSFLILSFFHNDLLFKIGLYDNKETLDNVTF